MSPEMAAYPVHTKFLVRNVLTRRPVAPVNADDASSGQFAQLDLRMACVLSTSSTPLQRVRPRLVDTSHSTEPKTRCFVRFLLRDIHLVHYAL